MQCAIFRTYEETVESRLTVLSRADSLATAEGWEPSRIGPARGSGNGTADFPAYRAGRIVHHIAACALTVLTPRAVGTACSRKARQSHVPQELWDHIGREDKSADAVAVKFFIGTPV